MYREMILASKKTQTSVTVADLFGEMDNIKAQKIGVTPESLGYNLLLILLEQLEDECGLQQALKKEKCRCYESIDTGKMLLLGACSYIYDKYCPKKKKVIN